MILRLAWRNMWRNPRRTLITSASVAFAVFLAITMKSLQTGVFDNLVRNMVNYYSGYIQIHKQGYWDERILDNAFPLDSVVLSAIDSSSVVKKYTIRIETFILASKGEATRGAFLCGTDPKLEKRLTALHHRLQSGGFLQDRGERDVLIGEGLARRLSLNTGDTLVLLGQGMYGSVAAGKYRIKGLLKLGAPDLNDAFILMDLLQAQELLSAPGMATGIAIEPVVPDRLEESVQSIGRHVGGGFEVMSWKTMMPEVWNHIRIDTNSLYIMMGFLYLIIAFGMFGTVLMMTNERKYEFGMLVAIGLQKGQLVRIVLVEIILMALLGALSGILLGWPVVYYLQEVPLHMGGDMAEAFIDYGFEPVFPARLNHEVFIEQTVIVLGLSLLMAIYPVIKSFRLDPISLIKR
ncbi:MAG: hypothetical protein RLZZ630_1634 [Bacteroidota bacterium]|jgi:ABC-type lipoprotein release transport system permease subunit